MLDFRFEIGRNIQRCPSLDGKGLKCNFKKKLAV